MPFSSYFLLVSFSLSGCDCNEDKKKTASTDVQVVTPTTSSSSSLYRTQRPASTQESRAHSTNYYITSNVPLTHTESKPKVSSDYITSADAPEFDTTVDPFLSPLVSTTTTTTHASKVIHGRIPWDRLFGGRQRAKMPNRLRRPSITLKTSTTVESTTVTPTTTPATMSPTTAHSLAVPQTLSPFRHTKGKESSLDDEYGDLTSADFEFTTLGPNIFHITTTGSSSYSKSSTTAETPPESQTLPSPPTVKPSVGTLDDALSSGSSGLLDKWVVTRQRPGRTRGRHGQRRLPFRGRRPSKLGVRRVRPTTTTEASTTEATTMESVFGPTLLPQQTVSLYKPLYMPYKKEDRTKVAGSTTKTSAEKSDVYDVPEHSSPKTPLIISTTYIPTTLMSAKTKEFRVHSNIIPPKQRNNGLLPTTPHPTLRSVKPTLQSSAARGRADKDLHFDTMTVYSYVDHNKPASANIAGFETTTQVLTNKPKIVGGNAASFTVLSNSDAFLPCEANGNPRPVVTWKRFSSTTGTKIFSLILILIVI